MKYDYDFKVNCVEMYWKGRWVYTPEDRYVLVADESDKLSPSEKEELIKLRAEAEYLRTENEAIKKSITLKQEREAAQLKAKKQQSLKNSGKKDSN